MIEKGLNQVQLSRLADVAPSALSQYLRGDRSPSGEALARIATALDVSMDYLFGRTEHSTLQDLLQNQQTVALLIDFVTLSSEKQQMVRNMVEFLKSSSERH